MEYFRLEYWSGLPFHSPGDIPNPGIKPGSPALQAGSSQTEPLGKPCGPHEASLTYSHLTKLTQ